MAYVIGGSFMNEQLMKCGEYILDHLDYVVISLSPAIVYGIFKLKKLKPRKNNLTSRYIKYNRQEDAINKRTKGGTIF
jgi:hypothetical protein